MSIHGRTLAASLQREALVFQNFSQALTVGETGALVYVPYPGTLDILTFAAMTIESTPNILFNISRFIPGLGVTVFPIGTTFIPPQFSTSGVLQGLGVSLNANYAGSTSVAVMANDIIGYQVNGPGGTCAIIGFAGMAVVRAIQDIRYYLNNLV